MILKLPHLLISMNIRFRSSSLLKFPPERVPQHQPKNQYRVVRETRTTAQGVKKNGFYSSESTKTTKPYIIMKKQFPDRPLILRILGVYSTVVADLAQVGSGDRNNALVLL
jgi:hypothetical protein